MPERLECEVLKSALYKYTYLYLYLYNKINANMESHDWEKVIGNDTAKDAWNKFKRIFQETVDRNIQLLCIRKE